MGETEMRPEAEVRALEKEAYCKGYEDGQRDMKTELKELPLVEITGCGSYAKVKVTGMTEECFDVERLEDFKDWNVSWIAIEYRHLHQLIKKLGSRGEEV